MAPTKRLLDVLLNAHGLVGRGERGKPPGGPAPLVQPSGASACTERTRLRLGVLDRQTGAPFDLAVVGLQPGAVRGRVPAPAGSGLV